ANRAVGPVALQHHHAQGTLSDPRTDRGLVLSPVREQSGGVNAELAQNVSDRPEDDVGELRRRMGDRPCAGRCRRRAHVEARSLSRAARSTNPSPAAWPSAGRSSVGAGSTERWADLAAAAATTV